MNDFKKIMFLPISCRLHFHPIFSLWRIFITIFIIFFRGFFGFIVWHIVIYACITPLTVWFILDTTLFAAKRWKLKSLGKLTRKWSIMRHYEINNSKVFNQMTISKYHLTENYFGNKWNWTRNILPKCLVWY